MLLREAERWTPEREVELAQRIDAGRDAQARLDRSEGPIDELRKVVDDGLAAREALIMENRPLVRSRVRKLTHKRRDQPDGTAVVEDLEADATLALIRAVDGFDWRKGYKFSTYAVPWIDGAIKRRFTKDATRPSPSLAITEDSYW